MIADPAVTVPNAMSTTEIVCDTTHGQLTLTGGVAEPIPVTGPEWWRTPLCASSRSPVICCSSAVVNRGERLCAHICAGKHADPVGDRPESVSNCLWSRPPADTADSPHSAGKSAGQPASAPGRIRTRDPLLRRQLLCPAELRAPADNCARQKSHVGHVRVAVCCTNRADRVVRDQAVRVGSSEASQPDRRSRPPAGPRQSAAAAKHVSARPRHGSMVAI